MRFVCIFCEMSDVGYCGFVVGDSVECVRDVVFL